MRTEDGYIIQQCLEGKSTAFGFLVDKYKRSVYALAYSEIRNFHDAQDITQEVFIKAYRNLNTLKRWDSFMGWLYRITLNVCRDWVRSASRRPDGEFIEDQEAFVLENPSMESYLHDRIYEPIREALESLPDIYRQVLMLRYYGGMTVKEMSSFLGVSSTTIDRRISEGQSRLKEEILIMMNMTKERYELPSSFTFNIVEIVRNIKIQTFPPVKTLPWGLSIASAMVIMFLGFGHHLMQLDAVNILGAESSLAESRATYLGELPFTANDPIRATLVTTGQSGDGKYGQSKQDNSQSTPALAPRGEEYKLVKSWPSEIIGIRGPAGMAMDKDGNFYLAAGIIHKFDQNGNLLAKFGSEGFGDGQFRRPFDVAVDSLGNIYVADPGNNRIQKLDSDGNFILKWGKQGSGEGQFERPCSLAVGPLDNVYVADTGNNRIQKFDPNGNFILKWGSKGANDNQFYSPTGLAFDALGNIYVSDENNHRIQKFDPKGNFLAKFAGFTQPRGVIVDDTGNIYVTEENNHIIKKVDPDGNLITKWGSEGSNEGQFHIPLDIMIDASGNIQVVDYGNSRIQKFDSDGKFLSKWADEATSDGQFNFPNEVEIDDSGNVYVIDTGNYRIQKFDSDGNFLAKWGSPGSDDGQLNWCNGLTVDKEGNVYLVDSGNYRIQQFDSNGNFIRKWGSWGQGNGQFGFPIKAAVDGSGDVYVTDTEMCCIHKFDSKGKFLMKWGSRGSNDDQFAYPNGIAVDKSGDVYVADSNNYRIQKFDSKGKFLLKWGSKGADDGQFGTPFDVALDSDGNVHVLDPENASIQKFDSKGNFISRWGLGNAEDGQFVSPVGIAIDNSGSIYISDSAGNRIYKLRISSSEVKPDNMLQGTWGGIRRTDLFQNYPNPFNPETWIPYCLSEPEDVKIKIYDLNGEIVRTLNLGEKQAGQYVGRDKAAYWDGRNENGEVVASNTYFYVMQAGDYMETKKMVLMR